MPFPPSVNPPKNSDDICAICHDPLLVPSSDKKEGPSFFIDDVEFRCKHHFHWACILEYALSSSDARKRCPLCKQSVLNGKGEFFVGIRNEGGHAGWIDFGSEIDRHLYFKANPEAERKMAFLSLMSQMEFAEAELYLRGEDPGAKTKMDPNVCYDTGRMTAMHMAALNDDVEGIQLLLKYGADKEFKSEAGETALDMAKSQNANKVIAFLTEEKV